MNMWAGIVWLLWESKFTFRLYESCGCVISGTSFRLSRSSQTPLRVNNLCNHSLICTFVI